VTDEPTKQAPIKPPRSDHPDDRARIPLEAAVSVIPGGGAVVKLVSGLVPTQAQKARSKWEGAISERTNQHSDRLDKHDEQLRPTAELSDAAVQLAVALARGPGDGMAGPSRDLDTLCKLVPEVGRKEVEEAAFELNSYGLVEIKRAIGGMWWLYLTQRFYEQIDHQVMGWKSSTDQDARALAQLLLEDEGREWTPTLHEASGWDKRRFNPAFAGLLRLIPTGRVSREIQPNYPARSVSLLPEDRAMLRRFTTSKVGG
jgi:hypothetical protein